MSYFEELGLAQPILKALAAGGYDTPTPIQQQAIPPLLEGRDLCGIAQTGTGKTAAFALPSLHHFATDIRPRPMGSCRMLVLSPTRELAAQIADKIRDYGRFLGLTVQCVFGGMPIFSQKKKLANGTDILVATPGRLLDLIDQRAFHLKGVEIFVLDEADQMMDLGFIHALKRIDALLPRERQSLFFSATMPQAIAELGARFLTDPVRVSVTPQATTAERVEQYVTFVDQREKQALLTQRLRDEAIDRALVFTRTKHGADRVVRHLAGAGIDARAIHGNKSQGQRTQAMQDFRSGRVRILVATDIAARGIDVPGVSHVFNFEMPNVAEQYVHRIGRTARAGADGVAYSFVANDERGYLKDIERLTKVRLMPVGLPEGFRQMVETLPAPVAEPRSSSNGAHGGQGRERGRGPARATHGRGGFERRDERHDAPRPHGDRSFGERPRGNRPQGERPHGERPYGERPNGERSQGDRSYGDRPRHDRPQGERPYGERAQGERGYGDRPRRDDRPHGDRPYGDRPHGERSYGDRPRSDHGRGEHPRGERAAALHGGDADRRPHQHRRGGPSVSTGAAADGDRPRNYGPRGRNAPGRFKKSVKRIG